VIRLTIAPEPAAFTEKVRKPGENALALLAGKPLPHKREGRPIEATKKVGGNSVGKTIDDFPYWQDCLDELHDAYKGICAYYGFRVEKATLPHVDHFVAKHDLGQALAYEWSNYRLVCGYANTCKNEHPDVLDPASIQDGWFQLDVDTLDVRADPALDESLRREIEATIDRLKLGEGRALEVRRNAMEHFRSGRVQFAFLEKDHPFLAKELARQGIRTTADIPPLPSHVVDAVEPEL
jgi:hypothetical protein